jgi:serine/threonine-protein kinase
VVLDLATRQRRDLVKGLVARYVAPGYLVIVRADGALLAAPFDQDRLQLTGPPVPIIEGLMTKPFGSADFVISREGTLVYVPGRTGVAGPPGEVVWVDRQGLVTPFNPPLVLTPPFNPGLALSPDGTRLAIDAVGPKGDDIWVKQLPSGTFFRLTFEGSSNIRPQWTADGKSILYVSERGSGGRSVWMQRADGGASAEQVLRGSEPIWEVLVSRDGNWFVYRTLGTNGRDIYASRAGSDTAQIPLLTTKFNELMPALSPDGRWLAYSSDESGSNEVYVRPFPRVGDGRWQISTGGGSVPKWAHSGRELFYQSRTNEMMAVGVTLSPSFAAGIPHKLFNAIPELYPSILGPYYDVTPDDRRFVMVRTTLLGGSAQAPGEGQLVMVENFREEIRRKLSAARQ